MTLSAGRRLQLLRWAQRQGAWIVEDDYDSEYRYESQPFAALQGSTGRGASYARRATEAHGFAAAQGARRRERGRIGRENGQVIWVSGP
jgi:DNA-binding transcriptional MocR family regulator